MKIVKGKQQRPQRVVIYGVESVGKTTFASKFPSPLFLDIEGGANNVGTDRIEIEKRDKSIPFGHHSNKPWNELVASIQKYSDSQEYNTFVIDSIDWAERLAASAICYEQKKQSLEEFGYGKGYVILAERISHFLNLLDSLIDGGKHVVFIAHSIVRKVEPPDILAAYDRYELKLEKKTAPLVKEWADELWFFRFKTKAISQENGKAKGIGGKERIILTTHSAAYDAKTRSGLAEELPMEWESVAHVFGKPAPKTSEPVEILGAETMAAMELLEANEEAVNAFLTGNGSIQEGETWRNASPKLLAQIKSRPQALIAKAKAAQMEVAA